MWGTRFQVLAGYRSPWLSEWAVDVCYRSVGTCGMAATCHQCNKAWITACDDCLSWTFCLSRYSEWRRDDSCHISVKNHATFTQLWVKTRQREMLMNTQELIMALSVWRRRKKKENASPCSLCDNSGGGNVRVLQSCAGFTSQDLNSVSKRRVSVARAALLTGRIQRGKLMFLKMWHEWWRSRDVLLLPERRKDQRQKQHVNTLLNNEHIKMEESLC